MLQVAKWDIVRAKEKEMQANLQRLKIRHNKMKKVITHVVLHKFLTKVAKKFQERKLKKEKYLRQLRGSM